MLHFSLIHTILYPSNSQTNHKGFVVMIMMKRVLLLFAALLLLLMADAAMSNVVEKKGARKLAQGSGDRRIPKAGVFNDANEPELKKTDVAPDDVVANNIDNDDNEDDDVNLGYKNYGKGSDTETHRYFSSDKPYRP
ncbi:hypothetical protein IC582_027038 [Cucumis melo]|uniref:Uncharacterized protein LOC103497782 n=1 Tax=Cucumis melo TaxID=3656 RepID=A0ABM3LCX8_CUCME|nr:uncharacterized protein LOC103497782 [Cucumis melo]